MDYWGGIRPWPHQLRAFDIVTKAIGKGKHPVVSCPTGGGKSEIFTALIRWGNEQGMRVGLFLVRNALFQQTIDNLRKRNIPFGTHASKFREYENLDAPNQICMLQTLNAKKQVDGKTIDLNIAIVDEAHQQREKMAVSIFKKFKDDGATLAGFTATPVEINHLYTECHQVALNSELRDGVLMGGTPAHLPCLVAHGAEISTEGMKRDAGGEFSLKEISNRWNSWRHSIFGNVLEEYCFHNPTQTPTLCFAPGVQESIWLTDMFNRNGVKTAHIDGDDCYCDGKFYKSERVARQDIIARLKAGEIKIVCNRFVLREGIDIPELGHLILATPIGSLASYVQVVGRVLRYHPSLKVVKVQDHGGNWWRFGSPNEDRDWSQWFDMPEGIISRMNENALIHDEKTLPRTCPECRCLVAVGRQCPCQKKPKEEIICPKCGVIREWGKSCHNCDWQIRKPQRMVHQRDGRLVVASENPIKRPPTKLTPTTDKLWKQMYFRARKSKTRMTFNQAYALFYVENGYYPPRQLANMPIKSLDWCLPVANVAQQSLHDGSLIHAAFASR